MEALVLAGDEAGSDAEAIKWRIDKLRMRQERRSRQMSDPAAVLAIMGEFSELFPPPAKSKALAAFRSALVDARVCNTAGRGGNHQSRGIDEARAS
jgi:hypothetical protein